MLKKLNDCTIGELSELCKVRCIEAQESFSEGHLICACSECPLERVCGRSIDLMSHYGELYEIEVDV